MAKKNKTYETPYITPGEVAKRWKCGRATVDRTAIKEKFSRLILGDGKNSPVRFVLKEVIAYEASRLIAMK